MFNNVNTGHIIIQSNKQQRQIMTAIRGVHDTVKIKGKNK